MAAGKTRYGLCPECQRQIPMTKAGLLRVHLASRGSSQRQQCDGSGGHTARWSLAEGSEHAPEIPPCSAAAAAAVQSEWDLADTLYREYKDMTVLWACSEYAEESTWQAVQRAVDRARELESQYPGWQYAATEDVA
jgi:hypothetical protein